MNVVVNEHGKELTPLAMATAANAVEGRPIFRPNDFQGENSRIAGKGHCMCKGNGYFKLLQLSHPDVQEGRKRYMQCMVCGCWSHL